MVISTAPVQEDWDDLCRATGLDLQPPSSPYWAGRHGFDAGDLSPEAYWSGVLGHPAAENEVELLESLDAALWARMNPATLDVLHSLSNEGAQLALLSNMPAGMSRRFEAAETWPGYFYRRYFSGRLGMAKPDPRIFKHVLADLQAAPENVVFIDDNPANIQAAEALGIRVVLHTEDTDLRQELDLLADPA
ncbi:HAD family phosphatase [Arthrobacter sp. Sa2CUA1]|uniref:HAD family phosphatase n=2 Tax=Arthrobacter gallicola TaxID=2762225 RepID=A0ABR8UUV3_9MICC|nr:HAD family phosphatase [Arthrobacter gallicola]